ncbi:hypothetical protein TNCV_2566201 [Trichonephila clavipes]|nr:hypothetical protein TNCV_2566201 [Trichonephila clavipes]
MQLTKRESGTLIVQITSNMVDAREYQPHAFDVEQNDHDGPECSTYAAVLSVRIYVTQHASRIPGRSGLPRRLGDRFSVFSSPRRQEGSLSLITQQRINAVESYAEYLPSTAISSVPDYIVSLTSVMINLFFTGSQAWCLAQHQHNGFYIVVGQQNALECPFSVEISKQLVVLIRRSHSINRNAFNNRNTCPSKHADGDCQQFFRKSGCHDPDFQVC